MFRSRNVRRGIRQRRRKTPLNSLSTSRFLLPSVMGRNDWGGGTRQCGLKQSGFLSTFDCPLHTGVTEQSQATSALPFSNRMEASQP